VVVSLQRLNAVEEVNAALGQVTVGAGAPEFPANIRSSRVEGFTTIRRLG
jgi:hypothetical protein